MELFDRLDRAVAESRRLRAERAELLREGSQVVRRAELDGYEGTLPVDTAEPSDPEPELLD